MLYHQYMHEQLNLYIVVNEGGTEIWLLYTGDLYIEVEPIWHFGILTKKNVKQFGF